MTEPQPAQPQDPTAADEDTQNSDAVARAEATPGEEYETVALADDADGQPQQEQSA